MRLEHKVRGLINEELTHERALIYDKMPKGATLVKLESAYQINPENEVRIAEQALEEAVPMLNFPQKNLA
ncbi:hypothetical protein AXW38_03920 [Yersinia ruckeri]|nr:hypothetical protein AXW20_03910 [Yersinia ruckeri]OIX39411.1 hypothetical protein AXW18_03915 [Yersinia ruckeri]OIX49460.1 hypothetical protein AXW21_03915 [Yersinia ruckeri]OIX50338.1 hypothetical protein AXW23_03905 [Yersinia ruckeri]OIX57357.1 hypothetical protein AXW24_03905 [Yersinia ruckeri]